MKFLIPAVLMAAVAAMAADRFIEGSQHSPVRVLIYEDLQCPDCADFRHMLDERLLPKYGTQVSFEHRDFPLAKHAWARKAAVAARFFDEESGIGAEFRRYCFEHQAEIDASNFPDKLAAFAKNKGLDAAKALSALEDAQLNSLVEKDFQDGVARGIAHTPTLLVGGQAFVEHFTLEEVSKAIDAEIAAFK
jgi:protein-disulfide isomerase